jgi:uncharacterized membrane protein
MIFAVFAALIALVFFVCSLVLLNYGRHLGTRYLQKGQGIMTGLTTVEGAVFALIGLLLAFTISGALQRFDDRRQLVIQEANAASTAHDRLALFESDLARELQTSKPASIFIACHTITRCRNAPNFSLANNKTRSST